MSPEILGFSKSGQQQSCSIFYKLSFEPPFAISSTRWALLKNVDSIFCVGWVWSDIVHPASSTNGWLIRRNDIQILKSLIKSLIDISIALFWLTLFRCSWLSHSAGSWFRRCQRSRLQATDNLDAWRMDKKSRYDPIIVNPEENMGYNDIRCNCADAVSVWVGSNIVVVQT